MKQTLLEAAKRTPSDRRLKKLSEDELNLIRAYILGSIKASQVAKALGVRHHNVDAWAMPRLKMAIEDGRISFK